MRLLVILTAAAALAACADDRGPPPTANAQADAAPGNASPDDDAGAVLVPVNTDPVAVSPVEPDGQCGAADHQWLVGQPRSRIPEPPPGATWRIACTACPVTEDYSPQRMNIFFDQETQIVATVQCG